MTDYAEQKTRQRTWTADRRLARWLSVSVRRRLLREYQRRDEDAHKGELARDGSRYRGMAVAKQKWALMTTGECRRAIDVGAELIVFVFSVRGCNCKLRVWIINSQLKRKIFYTLQPVGQLSHFHGEFHAPAPSDTSAYFNGNLTFVRSPFFDFARLCGIHRWSKKKVKEIAAYIINQFQFNA